MIRIVRSKQRSKVDYAMLATILNNGLKQVCCNSCKICPANRVCSSVKSATSFCVKLCEETDH